MKKIISIYNYYIKLLLIFLLSNIFSRSFADIPSINQYINTYQNIHLTQSQRQELLAECYSFDNSYDLKRACTICIISNNDQIKQNACADFIHISRYIKID